MELMPMNSRKYHRYKLSNRLPPHEKWGGLTFYHRQISVYTSTALQGAAIFLSYRQKSSK
jgi:hypothetical protein